MTDPTPRETFTATYRALRYANRMVGLGDTLADFMDDLANIAALEARHPVAAAAYEAAGMVDPLEAGRWARRAEAAACPF